MMTASSTRNLIVSEGTDNLFVRLPSHLVHELSGEDSNVEFLPLMISIQNNVIYTSWNGGLIYENIEAISVPRDLLPGASSYPQTVEVQALLNVPICTRVQVEPRNVQDWELLESYASALESGLLLQQISVVFKNQHVVLRFRKDQIEIIIQDIVVAKEKDVSSLLSSKQEDKSLFGLLRQDTEMIVSPKPRTARQVVNWSDPQRLVPCQNDWNDEMLELHSLVNVSPLGVPAACVLVNESIWDPQYEWALLASDDGSKVSNKHLVRVITHPQIPTGHSVLHPWVRLDLELALYWSSIRLRPISAPEELAQDSILLRPVRLDKDRSLPVYQYPCIKSSPLKTATPGTFTDEELTMPLHSMIPSSWLTPSNDGSPSFFRLESKEEFEVDISSPLDIIVILNKDDGLKFLQQSNHAAHCDNEAHTRYQPKTDCTANFLAGSVVTSIAWATQVLLDLEQNDRAMVAICGETGSGKTHSALLLCALARLKHQKATVYLDCKLLQESTTSLGDILTQLDEIFEQACLAKDAIIVLEDLDRLAPNLVGTDENDSSAMNQSANPIAISQSKVIADRLLQLIQATSKESGCVVSMVITCPTIESIHPSLYHSAGIFQCQLTTPVLSAKEQMAVLQQMIDRVLITRRGVVKDFDLQRSMESFRPRDLEKIAFRVCQKMRSSTDISLEQGLVSVLDDYTPLSHLSLKQTNKKCINPTWSNIGGLFQVKSKLEKTILHPTKYHLIYEQANIRLPRGILLFGPPGCGKTALIPALAQLCSMPLISCKGPEILDKYIGASEAKIRDLFQRASNVAPSILFLDELDALAPRRGSDHTGVTDRVVNQLLTFLDGVEETSGRVYIVGATSRPDKVDSALLRPGRLENHLYVGPPDKDEELYDVFCKLLSGWNISIDCQRLVDCKEQAFSKFLSQVSASSNGTNRFSPADMKAALDTAHVNAVHRALATERPEDIAKVEIAEDDLILALETTRPSLNEDDSRVLDQIYNSFRGIKDDTGNARERKLKTSLK